MSQYVVSMALQSYRTIANIINMLVDWSMPQLFNGK